MHIDFLNSAFDTASTLGHRFIGVKVHMEEFKRDEIIINECENFTSKLEYYQKVYDENLRHHFSKGISIVDVASGNSFDELQADLVD
ncbi:hypothetical protein BC351_01230 [Paenibacillus ferrarius]|uniref:Uncharacterized protein n=1 Tax=Paenibacillus ferrarius TaxID=1469647 RepID=A0A1V4HTQ1_9BACL|nr:hypothetical protein [Paenibacillus ferrarius]OPH61893.1 hypothetical protein BC351_01230 [Paenibacillus ferrarius]